MKDSKQKLTLTAAALGAVFFSAGAFADDRMYPYIAPSGCDVSVSLPNNSNTPEFSKYCKYALVLPQTTAPMRLSSFSPSANIMQCRGVLAHLESINKLEEASKTEADRIAELATQGGDTLLIAKEKAKKDIIRDALADLRSSYSGVEAGRAQIELDGGLPESQMDDIRNLNHQLTELKGIVFVRAPISEGYVSFNESNVSPDQMKQDPAVLSSTIPGFRAPGQATGIVVMTGALSGAITLSLDGACGLVRDVNYKIPLDAKIDENKVASLLTANYTYSVPVESGVEYHAKINVDNAIDAISHQIKTSGPFSISDLLKANLQGSSSEICSVKVIRYELPQNDASKTKSFDDELTGKVCGDMIKRVVDRMVTKGFIDSITRETATAAPAQAGGNVPSTAYRQVCYDDSFAGISYSSGCSNEAYTVLNWQDGMSAKTLQLDDDTHFSEVQDVSIGNVIQRWRTTTFVAQ